MSLLLQEIIRHGPITKKELQNRSGLSWGTVSTHTAELIERKFVVEEKVENKELMGRTPFLLDIAPTNYLIIGIDVNLDGVTAVLTDLKCRILARANAQIETYELGTALDAISGVVERLGFSAGNINNIVGIGLALPGNVDPESGKWSYKYAANFIDFSIARHLQEKYRCHVAIDHDPNCIARAEQSIGVAQDFENFVLVRLSTGIGASIIIDNQVYQGSQKAAGEFGHICIDQEGPVCRCGKKGCLEAFSSKYAVLKEARRVAKDGDRATVLSDIYKANQAISLDDLFCAAERGDHETIKILHRAACHLGIAVGNLINVLDPKCVVLWGELITGGEYFMDVVKEEVRRQVSAPHSSLIKASSVDRDGAALGAAALIVSDLLQGIYPILGN